MGGIFSLGMFQLMTSILSEARTYGNELRSTATGTRLVRNNPSGMLDNEKRITSNDRECVD
jgi:argonaute-like protein implicated in RNA metabolism and viral defense